MSLLKTLASLGQRANGALFGVKVESAVNAVVDSSKLKSGLTLLDGSLLQVNTANKFPILSYVVPDAAQSFTSMPCYAPWFPGA